jgi:hypothetical protein
MSEPRKPNRACTRLAAGTCKRSDDPYDIARGAGVSVITVRFRRSKVRKVQKLRNIVGCLARVAKETRQALAAELPELETAWSLEIHRTAKGRIAQAKLLFATALSDRLWKRALGTERWTFHA